MPGSDGGGDISRLGNISAYIVQCFISLFLSEINGAWLHHLFMAIVSEGGV